MYIASYSCSIIPILFFELPISWEQQVVIISIAKCHREAENKFLFSCNLDLLNFFSPLLLETESGILNQFWLIRGSRNWSQCSITFGDTLVQNCYLWYFMFLKLRDDLVSKFDVFKINANVFQPGDINFSTCIFFLLN